MRINSQIAQFFVNEINKTSLNCKVFLFGSRVDDTKKGGDIDIMILSGKYLKLTEKMAIKRNFYKKFGEQKIDIVNFLHTENHPFKDHVLSQPHIELT